jgi:hypothetical protein
MNGWACTTLLEENVLQYPELTELRFYLLAFNVTVQSITALLVIPLHAIFPIL